MPRRRPSQVRLDLPRPLRQWERRAVVSGLSSRILAEIDRVERERLWIGAAHEALEHWQKICRRPGRGVMHTRATQYDNWYDHETGEDIGPERCRDVLETLVHALSPRAARDLRALIAPLDERFLRRTLNDPFAPPDAPWWMRRIKRP